MLTSKEYFKTILKLLADKLTVKGKTFSYTDAVVEEIVRLGISPQYGAREIQRTVYAQIRGKLVNAITDNGDATDFTADFVDGEFVVDYTELKVETDYIEGIEKSNSSLITDNVIMTVPESTCVGCPCV